MFDDNNHVTCSLYFIVNWVSVITAAVPVYNPTTTYY